MTTYSSLLAIWLILRFFHLRACFEEFNFPSRYKKNQIYLRKVRDLRHSGCHNFVHFSGRKKYLSSTDCFLFNRKPSVITLAFPLSFRFSNVRHWVATLVVAAGDLGTRGKVLKKLIELADVLSDKLGNLVSFMAVMEGLSLPQVLFRPDSPV